MQSSVASPNLVDMDGGWTPSPGVVSLAWPYHAVLVVRSFIQG